MIHWAFLVLAFFAGAAAMYGFMWYMAGIYVQVMRAFEVALTDLRI